MPNNIVNADIERPGARNERVEQRFDKGMAIAAVVQAVPLAVWLAPLVLLFGFIGLALWFQRGNLNDFTSGVLLWLARLLIGAGVVLVVAAAWKCYRMYHNFMIDSTTRRIANAGVTKAVAAARAQELKNELLEADVQLRQQIPQVILALTQTGVAFKYDAKGTLEVLGVAAGRTMVNQVNQEQLGAGALAAIAGPGDLPTNVLYQDVRGQVPQGHILVGIGRNGIETRAAAIGACVWIVGLSGTGKTSTTVLRVEERAAMGHSFLGVDPHWFKDDSLTNAIKGYTSHFLMPMAKSPEDSKKVLQAFLNEFNGRKAGRIPKPWRKITLLVDEVGALMDPTTEEEEEIKEMLPSIARICGQEARNFEMGGIFISQQATGLAWLRKMALMVLAHQLLMESEKLLACNGDKAAAEDMKTWPVGRTYVYGVGFQDGPRTVQQPYFKSPDVDSNGFSSPDDSPDADGDVIDAAAQEPQEQEPQEQNVPAPVPALTGDLRAVYEAAEHMLAAGGGFNAREIAQITGFGKDKANNLLNRLADMGYISRRKAV